MDISSILSLALPVAVAAAGALKAAEKVPDNILPVTPADKGAGLTVLGAMVVLLTTVYKAVEGDAGAIDPAEVIAAIAVAYGGAVGLLGAFSAFLKR